jgi:ribosome maturation factor RimP
MNKDAIIEIIKESAIETEYMIYDFNIQPKGVNAKISVRIDSLNGITLDDCAAYSRVLDGKLELSRLLPNYDLEISSPGLKRKIRTLEEFKRFTGSPVKIAVLNGTLKVIVKGVISAVENNRILIVSNKKEMIFSFEDILQANLDY